MYVITGGTASIGTATHKLLLSQGHKVFSINLRGGGCLADLSALQGRQGAIDRVFRRYPDGIDILICSVDIGPTAPPQMIFTLNFFASVRIAEALCPLLKKKKGGCVVASFNPIINMTVRIDWVDMLSNVMDEERIPEFVRNIPRTQAASCYSSSKHALARWIRRVSPFWAVGGLRINPVVPGSTITPMVRNMTGVQMESALLAPIPTRYGRKESPDTEEIANGITFLAPPMTSDVNGAVLFVDGSIDALLRSERF